MELRPAARRGFLTGLGLLLSIAGPTAHGADVEAIVATVAAAASSSSTPVPAEWLLSVPTLDQLSFRGAVSYDEAGGGAGAMLYPVPNIAGLLVAVLVHAAISDSQQVKQKLELQAKADEILQPYRPVLDGFGARELLTRVAKLVERLGSVQLVDSATGPSGQQRLVDTAPVFTLMQDQRALLLQNTIVVRSAERSQATAKSVTVAVLSKAWGSADDGKNPVGYWTEADGARLKNESAALLALSLEAALSEALHAKAEQELPFKTFRFSEGFKERIERGQLLADDGCGRLVIKTLRGALLSVPVAGRDDSTCMAKQ